MWPSVAEMLSMLNELEVVIRTKETGISIWAKSARSDFLLISLNFGLCVFSNSSATDCIMHKSLSMVFPFQIG